jgi:hypothetical protein
MVEIASKNNHFQDHSTECWEKMVMKAGLLNQYLKRYNEISRLVKIGGEIEDGQGILIADYIIAKNEMIENL